MNLIYDFLKLLVFVALVVYGSLYGIEYIQNSPKAQEFAKQNFEQGKINVLRSFKNSRLYVKDKDTGLCFIIFAYFNIEEIKSVVNVDCSLLQEKGLIHNDATISQM